MGTVIIEPFPETLSWPLAQAVPVPLVAQHCYHRLRERAEAVLRPGATYPYPIPNSQTVLTALL